MVIRVCDDNIDESTQRIMGEVTAAAIVGVSNVRCILSFDNRFGKSNKYEFKTPDAFVKSIKDVLREYCHRVDSFKIIKKDSDLTYIGLSVLI